MFYVLCALMLQMKALNSNALSKFGVWLFAHGNAAFPAFPKIPDSKFLNFSTQNSYVAFELKKSMEFFRKNLIGSEGVNKPKSQNKTDDGDDHPFLRSRSLGPHKKEN